MPSKQLPASIRYLKVRLRILQRPSVWISSAVVLGAIVLLAETWKHPEWFANDSQPSVNQPSANSADTNLPTRPNPAPLDPFSSVDQPQFGTAEDAADPLSALSSTGLSDSSETDRSNAPLLLSPGRLPTARSSSSPSVPDPFASLRTRSSASSTNNSESNTAERRTTSSLDSGFPSGSQSNNSQNPLGSTSQSSGNQSTTSFGTNPLESAIERHNSPSSIQSAPSPQSGLAAPTSTPEATTASPELPTPTAPGTGQSTFVQPQVQPQPIPGQPSYGQTQPQPQFVPQTAPAPGTTGYTVPPAFRTNANTPAGPSFGNYNNQSNYSPSGVPSTVSPSTVSPSSPQSGLPSTAQPQFQASPAQPTPAPFSVPRAAPGQSIGGGRINSFSNP